MSTTFERLSAILARDYKLAPEQLTLDAPLAGLGIDSLGTMELLWTVEETFGITMPPDPVALPTLGDVVRYIDDLVAAQAADAASGPATAPTLRTP
jgi:acyl carrier protein